MLLASYNKRINAIESGKVIASFNKEKDIESIRRFQEKQEQELKEFLVQLGNK